MIVGVGADFLDAGISPLIAKDFRTVSLTETALKVSSFI